MSEVADPGPRPGGNENFAKYDLRGLLVPSDYEGASKELTQLTFLGVAVATWGGPMLLLLKFLGGIASKRLALTSKALHRIVQSELKLLGIADLMQLGTLLPKIRSRRDFVTTLGLPYNDGRFYRDLPLPYSQPASHDGKFKFNESLGQIPLTGVQLLKYIFWAVEETKDFKEFAKMMLEKRQSAIEMFEEADKRDARRKEINESKKRARKENVEHLRRKCGELMDDFEEKFVKDLNDAPLQGINKSEFHLMIKELKSMFAETVERAAKKLRIGPEVRNAQRIEGNTKVAEELTNLSSELAATNQGAPTWPPNFDELPF